MSSTSYSHDSGDDYLIETVETANQSAVYHGQTTFRNFIVSIADGSITNDGNDTETVTVEVVDGLEVARGVDPVEATVLDYDGDVTLTIDGVETTKTLTDGSVSFDVTTEKPAGSTIEIVAESLADHPAESDSAEIEVVEA